MTDTLSIGEFARRSGLSASALRFYDAQAVLRPVQVDHLTGYRLYDQEQLPTACLIRELRRLGLPLSEVKTFLEAPAAERHELISRHMEGVSEQFDRARALAEEFRQHIDRIDRQEADMTVLCVGGDAFAQGLDQALVAVGRAKERPELLNVLLESAEGGLRIVATDSYRLAFSEIVPQSVGGDFEALIAGSALKGMRTVLAGASAVALEVQNDVVGFDVDGDCRALPSEDGRFPDYRSLIEPRMSGHVLRADRQAVLDAIEASPPHETASRWCSSQAVSSFVATGRRRRSTPSMRVRDS